jgi:phage terminase large subunit-like protein
MTFVKTDKQREAVRLMGSEPKYTLLYGGSRSGKSFIIIRQIFIRALKESGSRHLIVRFAFNHAKQSLWYDTIPKVLSLCFPGFKPNYNKSDWFIDCGNGSQVWLGGLDDKERTEKVLGNEYSTIFVNEASQVTWSSYSTLLTRLAQKTGLINRIYVDCNPPSTQHWIYKLFIQNINPESNEAIDRALFSHMRMNPDDNLANLPPDYIDTVLSTLSHRQQKRFRFGEFVDDVEGALWRYDIIDKYRVEKGPELNGFPAYNKVVVAIDPSGTATQSSDEAGIVAAGVGIDGHCYIIDDVSGIYTPNQWATYGIRTLFKYEGDHIVAEVNQGWDMVKTIIRNIDARARVVSVHANRGKVARAEPVVALYERGMVHHIGRLDKLEDQMTSWDARESNISPGRIDALVYAVTDLMLKKAEFVLR